jgi:fucose permease
MNERRSEFLLLGLAYAGFISLGLPDGLLGVGWPSIRSTFGLRIDALASLLIVFTGGYLVSSFLSGRILNWVGVGMLLALSCFATAASLLGYAAASQWMVLVTLGFLAGAGAGAIDAGLNTYAATHFSTRAVNWLHACYGIGATTGPLIMTAVLAGGRSWRIAYAIVGVSQLALACAFTATRRLWTASPSQRTPVAEGLPYRATLRIPSAWLSIFLFFFYTGLESAAGTWAYTLFTEARSVPASAAGVWVSVYWGALTAGRIIAGGLAGVMHANRLLRSAMFGLLLGSALIWLRPSDNISFVGLALMGLSAAPIFPSLIATTPERLGAGHTANAVGFQISAAVLGMAAIPSLTGWIAGQFGLEAIGPCLFVAASLLLGLFEWLTAQPLLAQPSMENSKA